MISIVESVSGIFFYHLAKDGKPVCGSQNVVMPTLLPVSTWGLRTHLHEKYCSKCSEWMAKEGKP